jgi:hypothetical protein
LITRIKQSEELNVVLNNLNVTYYENSHLRQHEAIEENDRS